MLQPPRKLANQKMTQQDTVGNEIGMCIGKLLLTAPALHKLHLKVQGTSSYATHIALNEAYDALPDLIDTVIEGYQGASEKLLIIPETDSIEFTNVDDVIMFCRKKCDMITNIQSTVPYSEVVSNLDSLKDCFNKLKYKLIFLK
jgi:hypothetical protein